MTARSRGGGPGWEYTLDRRPILEPAQYDLLVLRWRHARPFGARDGIEYAVQVIGGPYDPVRSRGGKPFVPPPSGYDRSMGALLSAHFNVDLVRGDVCCGASSKLARAIRAAYDGAPPDKLDPDCLIGRRVLGVVTTVVNDSSKNPLHWSSQYSTADTFIGPAVGGPAVGDRAEALPF